VGGMGEVWCATDTNLGRQVAIKILHDAFSQDPDRLARFEREAKTLASLSHRTSRSFMAWKERTASERW
jgi:eukaryotic-like serine/threonine-protein kinase